MSLTDATTEATAATENFDEQLHEMIRKLITAPNPYRSLVAIPTAPQWTYGQMIRHENGHLGMYVGRLTGGREAALRIGGPADGTVDSIYPGKWSVVEE